MRTKWNQNARQTLAGAQRAQKAIEAGAASFIPRLRPNESGAVTPSLRGLPCAVLVGGA